MRISKLSESANLHQGLDGIFRTQSVTPYRDYSVISTGFQQFV